jgi:hypothetical protein
MIHVRWLCEPVMIMRARLFRAVQLCQILAVVSCRTTWGDHVIIFWLLEQDTSKYCLCILPVNSLTLRWGW